VGLRAGLDAVVKEIPNPYRESNLLKYWYPTTTLHCVTTQKASTSYIMGFPLENHCVNNNIYTQTHTHYVCVYMCVCVCVCICY
jgi:hypothetical protein